MSATSTQLYRRIAVLKCFNRSQGLDGNGLPTLKNIDLKGTEYRSRMDDGSAGFRIKFKIEKVSGPVPVPNPVSIQIYNVSATSRALLEKYNNLVVLEAGYGNSTEVAFKGHIMWGLTVKEGPDYITTIQAADGLFAFQNSMINTSFSQGTSVQNVVNTLIGALKGAGVSQGEVKGIPQGGYNQGLVISGKAIDRLREVCDKNDLQFSIQDGNVTILPYGSSSGKPLIILTPDTGLVGIPQQREVDSTGKSSLISFRCLMNPKLGYGQLVQVTSKFVNGIYTCAKVTHTGDTWGGDWFSDVEAT